MEEEDYHEALAAASSRWSDDQIPTPSTPASARPTAASSISAVAVASPRCSAESRLRFGYFSLFLSTSLPPRHRKFLLFPQFYSILFELAWSGPMRFGSGCRKANSRGSAGVGVRGDLLLQKFIYFVSFAANPRVWWCLRVLRLL